MTKYDEAFKRRVVHEYIDGRGGSQHVSQKYGVGRTVLRRWLNAYRVHGEAGLRKKHESYSAEFKMSVLQHMWRHELSYQRMCAVFDLREGNSVSRWERQYHEGGFEALKPLPKGRPPKMSQPKQSSQPATPVEERSRGGGVPKKLDELLRAKEQTAPKRRPKR
ncbi:transposase [Pandoraea horticolens]|uniref:Transposase n=1 Tax=Pandoraea horticolens TaxID=2508298 RepID=A0A5E4SVT8_9BURK|nr:transposase [Pandoraea horticolens]